MELSSASHGAITIYYFDREAFMDEYAEIQDLDIALHVFDVKTLKTTEDIHPSTKINRNRFGK